MWVGRLGASSSAAEIMGLQNLAMTIVVRLLVVAILIKLNHHLSTTKGTQKWSI